MPLLKNFGLEGRKVPGGAHRPQAHCARGRIYRSGWTGVGTYRETPVGLSARTAAASGMRARGLVAR
jgi:hypothetical protein